MNDSDVQPAWPNWGWSGGDTHTYSSPPQVSPWDYVEAVGIVHPDGCHVCRQYMDHLSSVAEADTSYAQATRERDKDLTTRFLEGFRRGRNAQRQHDSDRLRLYHTQRNEARATNLVYEEELRQAKEGISQLRDELFALRLSYDELSLIHRTPDSGWPFEEAISLAAPGEDLDFEFVADEGSLEDGSAVESLLGQDSIESGRGSSEDGRLATYVSGHQSGGRLDRPLDIDGQHIRTFVGTGDYPPNDISPETHINIGGRSPTRSFQTLPPECYTPEEIVRELMPLDNQTQTVIRGPVMTIMSDIYSTHSQHRGERRELLVGDWMPLNPEVDPTPLEIFVDASDVGIGFTFGDQWQAWRLRDGWKTRQREIQWAEAVAAELGIRLMIQAGYTRRKILLRSDNMTVVQAIPLEYTSPPQIQYIVKEIHALCASHQISLSVRWVRGVNNPADDPSRMRSRDPDKRFPHAIEIPPHLEDFVFPVDFVCS